MIRLSGMDYMNIFGYTGRLGFTNSNLGKTNTHYSNYGIGLSKRNTNSTYSTALTNSQKTLSTVGNEASALVKSANKLAGDVSYKNVEAFVENYNDTVAALSKTVNSTVRSSGNSMQRMTGIMKNNLSKIGITVASDGKMSVDEESLIMRIPVLLTMFSEEVIRIQRSLLHQLSASNMRSTHNSRFTRAAFMAEML